MLAPDPHAAGSTRHSNWWVIVTQQIGRLSNLLPPTYSVTMSTSKPKSTPTSQAIGPYPSKSAAQAFIDKTTQGGHLPNLNPFSWLGSLGGMIGSGIESGFVTLIKDLWDVVIGPLEVLIGGIIIIVTLMMYFRHDIMNLVSAAGGLAMAA